MVRVLVLNGTKLKNFTEFNFCLIIIALFLNQFAFDKKIVVKYNLFQFIFKSYLSTSLITEMDISYYTLTVNFT